MTITYADPELLIAAWLHTQTGYQAWADPELPTNAWSKAPVLHVQRGAGFGEPQLSLDDVTLDIEAVGARADHVRQAGHDVWTVMTLALPRTTFDNGIFCKYAAALTQPLWAPATGVYRRTAAYRVILHGFVVS